mmetsp:Transcript_31438/g.62279  ORF Transcript_31438/g.62279 Transcript_31438/m.62279 type:complete len:80 (+) Transcript_31438:187-426(+)
MQRARQSSGRTVRYSDDDSNAPAVRGIHLQIIDEIPGLLLHSHLILPFTGHFLGSQQVSSNKPSSSKISRNRCSLLDRW